MKKILLLLVVALSLSSFCGTTEEDFNFVGKWMGKDEGGLTGGFIFDDEGYVTFIKDGMEVGGKNSVIEGRAVIMKYAIDQNVRPIKFDIEMESEGMKKTALFIIKIIDKNKIVVAGDMSDVRPKSFTKDNSVTLTRK
jgi:hypothetical protein